MYTGTEGVTPKDPNGNKNPRKHPKTTFLMDKCPCSPLPLPIPVDHHDLMSSCQSTLDSVVAKKKRSHYKNNITVD